MSCMTLIMSSSSASTTIWYQIYCEHVKILLSSSKLVWAQPIRALANSVENVTPTDAADDDKEECLKCFSKVASSSTASAALSAPMTSSTTCLQTSLLPAKKAKIEASPPLSTTTASITVSGSLLSSMSHLRSIVYSHLPPVELTLILASVTPCHNPLPYHMLRACLPHVRSRIV